MDRLELTAPASRLTHSLFRYPARFHAPVAHALLERYTQPGDTVFDPFVGSGTLLVEAMVAGRSSIGVDTDPVAVSVARAKVHRFHIARLTRTMGDLRDGLNPRDDAAYSAFMFTDLSDDEYRRETRDLREWIPDIPKLFHWFRRYVVVDLARIRRHIETTDMPSTHRALLRVVFASIIRNSSNADPVPVSGLEVTSHMLRRDAAGRLVNPYTLFDRAMFRAAEAVAAYAAATPGSVTARVVHADTTALSRRGVGNVDAVITSPPYHGAVDYYRRHQLEMYWLGHTVSHEARLALLHTYVGRPKVPRTHPFVRDQELTTTMALDWERRIRRVSAERADAFHHYLVAMTRVFGVMADRLPVGGPAVIVVGHSSWNSSEIPTTDLFVEVAGAAFDLDEVLWYPVKNRYMSYARRNGADINREYVLAFRRH